MTENSNEKVVETEVTKTPEEANPLGEATDPAAVVANAVPGGEVTETVEETAPKPETPAEGSDGN